MYSHSYFTKKTAFHRISSGLLAFTLCLSLIVSPVQAQLVSNLPNPGQMLLLSQPFSPVSLRGITINPANPFLFDFIVDRGDDLLLGSNLESESEKLIKYFLTALTIPDDEGWVNLSPYENDRIISDSLSVTEMGRTMLEQDYILKQLSASLTNPENELGKKFWDNIYQKANKEFGSTHIPINTFNKVWIVPDKAIVVEEGGSAFTLDWHLKVMMEEDYLALDENMKSNKFGIKFMSENKAKETNKLSSEFVRDIILPELEKEINEGRHFAPMRQVYLSVILATWFKRNLKESLLGKVYVDQGKVAGVDTEDKEIKDKIYRQYLQAFKLGVYNFIKEEEDSVTHTMIPRKYFSGGVYNIGAATKKVFLEIKSDNVTPTQVRKDDLDNTGRFAGGSVQLAASNAEKKVVQTGADKKKSPDESMLVEVDDITELLNLDELDANFLKALYGKVVSVQGEPLRLGETTIPASYLSEEERENLLGLIDISEIRADPQNVEAAKQVTKTIYQMRSGLGSSFHRKKTLERLRPQSPAYSHKSIDSIHENVPILGKDADGNQITVTDALSVAQLTTQKYIYKAEKKEYKEISLVQMVNDESQGPVTDFFEKEVYFKDQHDATIPEGEKRSVADVLQQTPGVELAPVEEWVYQEKYPVIDSKTKAFIISEDPESKAPGGHAFLATYILDMISKYEPLTTEHETIELHNSEALNDTAEPAIDGWMVRNNIPIVLIMTEKTEWDTKGGFAVIETAPNGKKYAQLTEIGEAKAAGKKQVAEFMAAGLTKGEKGAQPFNTNIIVINKNVLGSFSRRLRKLIGEEEFFRAISAKLILNPKEKTIDGKQRSVYQLEAAQTSVMMAINQYVTTTERESVKELMQEYGLERLVHIVNYPKELRVDTFAAQKFALHQALYNRTDLFEYASEEGRLKLAVNKLRFPELLLHDSFYDDLETYFYAWGEKIFIEDLDSLEIIGKFFHKGASLGGMVKLLDLRDDGDPFDLGDIVLKDEVVLVRENGEKQIIKLDEIKKKEVNLTSQEKERLMTPIISTMEDKLIDITEDNLEKRLKVYPISLEQAMETEAVKSAMTKAQSIPDVAMMAARPETIDLVTKALKRNVMLDDIPAALVSHVVAFDSIIQPLDMKRFNSFDEEGLTIIDVTLEDEEGPKTIDYDAAKFIIGDQDIIASENHLLHFSGQALKFKGSTILIILPTIGELIEEGKIASPESDYSMLANDYDEILNNLIRPAVTGKISDHIPQLNKDLSELKESARIYEVHAGYTELPPQAEIFSKGIRAFVNLVTDINALTSTAGRRAFTEQTMSERNESILAAIQEHIFLIDELDAIKTILSNWRDMVDGALKEPFFNEKPDITGDELIISLGLDTLKDGIDALGRQRNSMMSEWERDKLSRSVKEAFGINDKNYLDTLMIAGYLGNLPVLYAEGQRADLKAYVDEYNEKEGQDFYKDGRHMFDGWSYLELLSSDLVRTIPDVYEALEAADSKIINKHILSKINKSTLTDGIMDSAPAGWTREHVEKVLLPELRAIVNYHQQYVNPLYLLDAFDGSYKEGRRRSDALRKVQDALVKMGGELDDLTAQSDFSRQMIERIENEKNTGGIDFNPRLLDLQIKRDGRGVPLPLPMQDVENINIEGLYPIIINIAPANIQTMPFLSRLKEQEERLTLSSS